MIEAKEMPAQNMGNRQPFTIQWGRIGLYAAFIVFVLVVLIPIYWIMRSSVATSPDLHTSPINYFPHFTLQNFQTLIQQVPFFEYVRNSLIFAITTTLLTLVAGFLAAYAFARIQFPGSGVILWILLLTMALPDIGTIVPLYRILAGLHLLDTITGLSLVLGSALTPFTVWVLVSFIKQVPYEIEEAAVMDGATLPQIFVKILLPVTRPGLVTMGLINFINAWNNLLYPLSFSVGEASKTLSVSITEVYNGYSPYGKPWELIMAIGVTMVLPVVFLMLFSQKSIVRGLTGGAVK
jgi:ABC-type glycerol-3-phosphate transport system permease component